MYALKTDCFNQELALVTSAEDLSLQWSVIREVLASKKEDMIHFILNYTLVWQHERNLREIFSLPNPEFFIFIDRNIIDINARIQGLTLVTSCLKKSRIERLSRLINLGAVLTDKELEQITALPIQDFHYVLEKVEPEFLVTEDKRTILDFLVPQAAWDYVAEVLIRSNNYQYDLLLDHYLQWVKRNKYNYKQKFCCPSSTPIIALRHKLYVELELKGGGYTGY